MWRTYFSAFLRAAQYFFILALTAFFCAADIFERLRLGSRASATPRADFAMVRRAAFEIVARSGNVFSKAAASVWSSFQRASAPRRAHLRMSVECFAIPQMVCRFAEEVQTWHSACSMTASIARSPIWRSDKHHIPSYGRRHRPPGTSISGNANTSLKEPIDVWKPFPLRWWALWRWLSPRLQTRSVRLNQQGFPRRDRVCRDKRAAPDQCCWIVHPGVWWPQLRHTSDIRAGSKCRTIAWPLKPQRAHTSRSTAITAAARNRDQVMIHRSRIGTPVEEMGSTSATSIRSSSSGPVPCDPVAG